MYADAVGRFTYQKLLFNLAVVAIRIQIKYENSICIAQLLVPPRKPVLTMIREWPVYFKFVKAMFQDLQDGVWQPRAFISNFSSDTPTLSGTV